MQLLYTDCGYPRWTTVLVMPNAIFFYILFNDFYKAAYKPLAESDQKNEAIGLETNRYNGVNSSTKYIQNNTNLAGVSEKKIN